MCKDTSLHIFFNMNYKILDFEFYGNIVKLYLGNTNVSEWTGEDWDNLADESFSPVNQEYVSRTILLVINPDKFNVLYFDDMLGNQEFTKNMMTRNKYPFMSISKKDIPYSEGFWHDESKRYCLGDIIEVKDKIKFIPIGL